MYVGGGGLRGAEEREGRKPGGSFVKLAGSSDEGQGLMAMGCHLYGRLGICVMTWFFGQILLSASYVIILLAALGVTAGPVMSKQPDLGKGMFKASSWILLDSPTEYWW